MADIENIDVTVDEAKAAAEENIGALVALAAVMRPGIDAKQLDTMRSIAQSSFMLGVGWMRRELHERASMLLEELAVAELNKNAPRN